MPTVRLHSVAHRPAALACMATTATTAHNQTHTELRPVTRQATIVAAIDTDLYKKQLAHCQLQHYSIANDSSSSSSSSSGATRSHHLAACQEVGRLLRAATTAAYTHDTDR
jgi:hypothetical protein